MHTYTIHQWYVHQATDQHLLSGEGEDGEKNLQPRLKTWKLPALKGLKLIPKLEIKKFCHIYIYIYAYLHIYIYIYIIIFQIMILKELICSCYRLAGAANLRHLELQLAPSLKSRTTKAWGNELGPPVVYAIHGQHVRQGVAIAMDQ